MDMVKTLGTPTIFFTLSAADLEWPELFDIISPGEDLDNLPINIIQKTKKGTT